MSIISDVFAGGAEGILKGVKDVVSSFKADPLELAKLEIALAQTEANLAATLSTAQTKVNEIEAASSDKFTSRWRPACGWLAASGLGYAVIVTPILTWASVNFGITPPPHVDVTVLMELLFGLLGLAGMRTYEKYKGVARKHR